MKEFQAADRYARSVFELADEQGEVEALLNEFAAIAETMRGEPELPTLLQHPLVKRDEKLALIRNALAKRVEEKDELRSLIERFLMLLIERGRFDLVPLIGGRLREALNEKKGVQQAAVYTARPLAPSVAETLERTLEKVTKKKIVLDLQTNPLLLGGVRIRLGNRLIDGSLRSKLEALSSQLRMVKV